MVVVGDDAAGAVLPGGDLEAAVAEGEHVAPLRECRTEGLAGGDREELLAAMGHVARASGMTDLERQTGWGRESLYKALRPGADPRFSTLMKVLHALGVHLQAVPDKIA